MVETADFTGLVQSFKLRHINPNVVLPLPIVLSMCLSQVRLLEMVTQDWRDANIVPLFKKDERHLASNYRPVSLNAKKCQVI
jgi:hypothetical protein